MRVQAVGSGVSHFLFAVRPEADVIRFAHSSNQELTSTLDWVLQLNAACRTMPHGNFAFMF